MCGGANSPPHIKILPPWGRIPEPMRTKFPAWGGVDCDEVARRGGLNKKIPNNEIFSQNTQLSQPAPPQAVPPAHGGELFPTPRIKVKLCVVKKYYAIRSGKRGNQNTRPVLPSLCSGNPPRHGWGIPDWVASQKFCPRGEVARSAEGGNLVISFVLNEWLCTFTPLRLRRTPPTGGEFYSRRKTGRVEQKNPPLKRGNILKPKLKFMYYQTTAQFRFKPRSFRWHYVATVRDVYDLTHRDRIQRERSNHFTTIYAFL